MPPGAGCRCDVLVPGGKHADQPLLRVASRHWFGELLTGGVRVHENQASMIHQKLLIVDDWWVVMGTTNMDNRSFEHNDEVNVAFPDEGLARQISALYTRDLSQSTRVTFEECATVHSPSAPCHRLRGCSTGNNRHLLALGTRSDSSLTRQRFSRLISHASAADDRGRAQPYCADTLREPT